MKVVTLRAKPQVKYRINIWLRSLLWLPLFVLGLRPCKLYIYLYIKRQGTADFLEKTQLTLTGQLSRTHYLGHICTFNAGACAISCPPGTHTLCGRMRGTESKIWQISSMGEKPPRSSIYKAFEGVSHHMRSYGVRNAQTSRFSWTDEESVKRWS